MGMIQKVLWWILWYAILWFAFCCLIGGLGDIVTFKPLQAILIFATFIVPGWYATRKVKQKAQKMEMEQRTRNFPSQQSVQPPSSPVLDPMPQIINNGSQQPQKPAISQPLVMQEKAAVTTLKKVSPQSNVHSQGNLPNLNNAVVDDLTKLSGVNRILAMKIISVRDKEGTYSSFEDLFSRVQLTPQAQEELRSHFSIPSSVEGRFIDF